MIPDELLIPYTEEAIAEANKILTHKHKFLNHTKTMEINWTRINHYIPEYLTPDNSIVDISCGSGTALEIFRYYGCKYLGVDINKGYAVLLKDKKLDFIFHDCSITPYPLPAQGFDVLVNYGAITFYENSDHVKDISYWPTILNEFARIAKKCILLGVNVGGIYDNGGDEIIKKWIESSNFTLQYQNKSIYKLLRK